ncbi:helix-turn-helix domain-containing protein [Glutamicibacter sp.]|uniref:MarR family winged helix-turn-helix transcriptional regulator n=1 Tax=Glutamicibacter sp. TaxID=1931995 RepID=UPI0028BF51EB|nr:helix-turn-helix domain-containing protein [Glutamicibacter sp.]
METASSSTPRAERGALYDATEEQMFALIAVVSRSKRAVASQLEHLMTPAALPVLGIIMRTKRITQSEICERLLMDKAALSRMVAKLEELGLVVRETDEQDRRVSHLLPTDLAVERWCQWLQEWRTDLRSRLAGWDDADLETLISLLGRLNSDMQVP